MNRIDPIHIVVLLTIILFVVIYNLDVSKSELEENKKSFKTTQAVATKLVSLKDVYANQTSIRQSLKRVLNDASIRSAGIDTKFKSTSLTIDADSIDLKTLNLLLGKLLNASYIVDSMKVKRISNTKADLQMEIIW